MAFRTPSLNFVTSPSGLLVPEVVEDTGNERADITFDIQPSTADGWVLTTDAGEVVWAPAGGAGGGVDSIEADGSGQLTGDVTFSEGTGITLTQTGQDIEIGSSVGGGNWVLITDTVLGGTSSTIDFTSISGSYKHLYLISYLRNNNASTDVGVRFRFNNDSGSNYDYQRITGASTSIATSGSTGNAQAYAGSCPGNNATANHFGFNHILIPNYANTSGEKNAEVIAGEKISNADNAMQLDVAANFWRSTNAITRVTIIATAGSFVANSRVSLYGLD